MVYYAALLSLLQTLEQIPEPHQQITYLHCRCGVLRRLLRSIVDSSQTTGNGLKIKDLEGRIRDASYEAEDIIQSQIMSREYNTPQNHAGQEFQGLEKVIDEFDSILDDLSNKIKSARVEDVPLRNSFSVGSSRFVAGEGSSSPVGLDDDLLRIKDWLAGSPTSKLKVVSIVGMGGIGKTTLVRHLYNDSFTRRYFDIRAWTVVSQKCDVQEMFTDLLDSITHGDGRSGRKSIKELAELLCQSLQGKRYFIVMDDVWDNKVWDEAKMMFLDEHNGSRIIITTRLAEVAVHARYYGESYIHQMSLLSPEASWNLLRDKVFGEECCPIELVNTGKKIAKKCKGLPLTIVVIGGILYNGVKTQDNWEDIAENLNLAVSGNDDQLMETLSLSYNLLPCHLKLCFLCMGVFPEEYEIFVSQLIQLWIAEGFIKPPANERLEEAAVEEAAVVDKLDEYWIRGRVRRMQRVAKFYPKAHIDSLEEVAKDYLKHLIDRSLVMVRKKNPIGDIKTCILHDMCRELCIRKAQEEKFVRLMNWEVYGFPQGKNNHRRVSIHSNIVDCLTDIDESYVRSFLCFCKPRSELLSFTMSCRLLRVFHALTIRFYEFPIEIVELVHLRYLAFLYRGNSIPDSISKLRNLQTLIALSVQPIYLPSTIWEMPQLRHLFFEESFLPEQIIWGNSVVFENLQTLSGVTNFRCSKKKLSIMPNLKKLRISFVHDIDTKWSSYEFNNLVRLSQLKTLKCLFIPKLSRAARPLPVNLAFPPNLRKLTLSGCRISWEKITVIGSLPDLEVLKLKDHAFEGSVWEIHKGEFTSLKFLLIDMSFLERWHVHDSHFPKLHHLSLSCCPKLAEIPTAFRDIRTLEMLELYECSPSAVASAKLIQEGRRGFRVRVNSYSDYYYSQQQTSLRRVHRDVSAW